MAIPMLRVDHSNHYFWGSIVACAAVHGAHLVGIPRPAAALIGSTVAGFAKEGYDWLKNRLAVRRGQAAPHSVEWGDVLATAAGGIPVALAS